jgi:hypothetical protein
MQILGWYGQKNIRKTANETAPTDFVVAAAAETPAMCLIKNFMLVIKSVE